MKLLIVFALVQIAFGAILEEVQIDTTTAILDLDEHFLGSGWEMWSYLDSIQYLSNPVFRKLVSQLGPGALRVGGITCDWVNYTVPQSSKNSVGGFWPNYDRPISPADFKALVDFAAATNMEFVFGLNELQGRNCHFNGTDRCVGKWDTSNVRSFLTYLRDNKVGPILGFELGNELTWLGSHIPMSENVADYIALNELFTEIWPDKQTRPPIYGPSIDHCDADVDMFLSQTKSFLTGFTYHTYPGNNGSQLVTQEVSIEWLKQNLIIHDVHANSAYCIAAWNRIGKPVGMHLWITETNAAWDGIKGVMNAFENSFWYLASLGQHAKIGVERHCRWALFGGDTFAFVTPIKNGFQVNPDYWVAVLHKRLIGTKVLTTTGAFAQSLVYAHCGKTPGTVTLIVVNPSTSDVTLELTGISSAVPRDEYIFTAPALSSTAVQLNGNTLVINADGSLPPTLRPRTVSSGDIVLPKYSYGYIVLTDASAKVCQ